MAGGGSFLGFPALLFVGVAPVSANATNAAALWPAGVASAVAYRRDLELPRREVVALSAVSLLGGLIGSLLLLRTPDPVFRSLLPWLLLLATLAFTLGHRKRGKGREGGGAEGIPTPVRPGTRLVAVVLLQFLVAVYGGFFGGGMGILMLAILTLLGLHDIHTMNGLKAILGVLINGAAVVTFLFAGAVAMGPFAVIVAGATLGGYGGALLARRLDAAKVRRGVVAYAWVLTAYFFVKAFAPSG